MNFKMLLIVTISITIMYLVYIVYIKKQNKKPVKKVTFFGLPTEIDNIKPTFKTEPIINNNINNVISPMNNLEKLSEYSVDF